MSDIIAQAIAPDGVYGQHLEEAWNFLNHSSELRDSFEKVVLNRTGFTLPAQDAYCLNSLDLVTLNGLHATVSCPLYLKYFTQKFKQQELTKPPTSGPGKIAETQIDTRSTDAQDTRPLPMQPKVEAVQFVSCLR